VKLKIVSRGPLQHMWFFVSFSRLLFVPTFHQCFLHGVSAGAKDCGQILKYPQKAQNNHVYFAPDKDNIFLNRCAKRLKYLVIVQLCKHILCCVHAGHGVFEVRI